MIRSECEWNLNFGKIAYNEYDISDNDISSFDDINT